MWPEVKNDIKNYDQTSSSTPISSSSINYQLSPTNYDRPTSSKQINLMLDKDSLHNETALNSQPNSDIGQNSHITSIASEAQQSVRSEPSIVMSAKKFLMM